MQGHVETWTVEGSAFATSSVNADTCILDDGTISLLLNGQAVYTVATAEGEVAVAYLQESTATDHAPAGHGWQIQCTDPAYSHDFAALNVGIVPHGVVFNVTGSKVVAVLASRAKNLAIWQLWKHK